MRGHFGALRLPPAGSWPSHTARTEVRPCSTMPARAANNPALIPTARHAPESTSDSKSEKRVGSRLRADSASHEDGNHGCSVCARPGRPRNNIQLAPSGASGPDAKSGLRAQRARRGVGSVSGSRKGAPGPSGRPPRPHPRPPPSPPRLRKVGRGDHGGCLGRAEGRRAVPADRKEGGDHLSARIAVCCGKSAAATAPR